MDFAASRKPRRSTTMLAPNSLSLRALALLSRFPTVAAVGGRDEFWDDFSDNLATDLAPFITLFGEGPTKQFLSESISHIDYFIFCIAPLGILTALVSMIRVRGSPSLRAFIGRSQEGWGPVEAEICSSTSRDVGEVYNNGGIARILGNPKCLEVAFNPSARRGDFFVSGGKKGAAGIYGFKEYYEQVQHHDQGTAHLEWRETNPGNGPGGFAPNPNLTLNIWMKRYPKWVLRVASVVGVIVQAVVIGVAAYITYVLKLPKNDADVPVYGFPLMVGGTLILSVGAYFCAYLIGGSSQERVFKRSTVPKTNMFWVQPGGQILGDITLEAFAYTDYGDPIKEYVTSWRTDFPSSPLLVSTACLVTLLGFGLQFIGLRAMHSSIAISQLVATLILSMIRSLLRAQRLSSDHNLLHESTGSSSESKICGHELDWLALHMARVHAPGMNKGHRYRRSPKGSSGFDSSSLLWTISGNISNSTQTRRVLDWRARPASPSDLAYITGKPVISVFASTRSFESPLERLYPYDPSNSSLELPVGMRALAYRARLARLTSLECLTTNSGGEWKSNVVNVRDVAKTLAKAIQRTAHILFSSNSIFDGAWKDSVSFIWALSCAVSAGDMSTEEPLYLSISRDRPGSAGWEIDEAEVEAVLGLWLWSLERRSTQTLHSRLPMGKTTELENIVAVEDISVHSPPGGASSIHQTLGQLKVWFGETELERLRPTISTLNDTCVDGDSQAYNTSACWALPRTSSDFDLAHQLDMTPPPSYHSADDWGQRQQPPQAANDATDNGICAEKQSHPPSSPSSRVQFFNWTSASLSPSPSCPKLRVASLPTSSSRLTLCAQDILVSFLSAVFAIIETPGGKSRISPQREGHSVTNTLFNRIFEDPEVVTLLGSPTQARTAILPAILPKLETMEILVDASSRLAHRLRHDTRFEDAEDVLQWCLNMHSFQGMTLGTPDTLRTAYLEVGEMYRHAALLRSPELTSFVSAGKKWLREKSTLVMVSSTGDTIDANPHPSVYGHWYSLLLSSLKNARPKDYSTEIITAIRQQRFFTALVLISHNSSDIPPGDLASLAAPLSGFETSATMDNAPLIVAYSLFNQSLLYCPSPVASLIEELSRQSDPAWTPVLADVLLDLGWDIDNIQSSSLHSGRTALSYACELGNLSLVKLFRERDANLECEADDGMTPLDHAAQAGHVDVVKYLLSQIDSSNYGRVIIRSAPYLNPFTTTGHFEEQIQDSDEGFIYSHYESQATIYGREKKFDRAVWLAALNSHPEVVSLFTRRELEYGWCNSYRSLCLACALGLSSVADILLNLSHDNIIFASSQQAQQTTADTTTVLSRGDTGPNRLTPLHAASYGGSLPLLQKIITTGLFTDAQAVDPVGLTPLHIASLYGHLPIVEFLTSPDPDSLSASFSPSPTTAKIWSINSTPQTPHFYTPFHLAISRNHIDVASYLLSLCEIENPPRKRLPCPPLPLPRSKLPEGEEGDGPDPYTHHPLHFSILFDRLEVVESILATLEAQNSMGDLTSHLFHLAAAAGAARTLEWLAEHILLVTPSLALEDEFDDECAWAAMAEGGLGKRTSLTRGVKGSLDVEGATENEDGDDEMGLGEETLRGWKKGMSPLHKACLAASLPTVRALIARGADLDAEDEAGRTPLELATAVKSTGCVVALLSTGRVGQRYLPAPVVDAPEESGDVVEPPVSTVIANRLDSLDPPAGGAGGDGGNDLTSPTGPDKVVPRRSSTSSSTPHAILLRRARTTRIPRRVGLKHLALNFLDPVTGLSPLMHAAAMDDVSVARMLVDRFHCSPHQRSKAGVTAWEIARYVGEETGMSGVEETGVGVGTSGRAVARPYARGTQLSPTILTDAILHQEPEQEVEDFSRQGQDDGSPTPPRATTHPTGHKAGKVHSYFQTLPPAPSSGGLPPPSPEVIHALLSALADLAEQRRCNIYHTRHFFYLLPYTGNAEEVTVVPPIGATPYIPYSPDANNRSAYYSLPPSQAEDVVYGPDLPPSLSNPNTAPNVSGMPEAGVRTPAITQAARSTTTSPTPPQSPTQHEEIYYGPPPPARTSHSPTPAPKITLHIPPPSLLPRASGATSPAATGPGSPLSLRSLALGPRSASLLEQLHPSSPSLLHQTSPGSPSALVLQRQQPASPRGPLETAGPASPLVVSSASPSSLQPVEGQSPSQNRHVGQDEVGRNSYRFNRHDFERVMGGRGEGGSGSVLAAGSVLGGEGEVGLGVSNIHHGGTDGNGPSRLGRGNGNNTGRVGGSPTIMSGVEAGLGAYPEDHTSGAGVGGLRSINEARSEMVFGPENRIQGRRERE